jgi:hypothetical protein
MCVCCFEKINKHGKKELWGYKTQICGFFSLDKWKKQEVDKWINTESKLQRQSGKKLDKS